MCPDTKVVTIGIQGPAGAGVGTHESSASFSHVKIVTSSTRPSSPVEGQLIYETDTNKFMYWTGSAWTQLIVAPPVDPPTLKCLVELKTTEQSVVGATRATVLFNTIHRNDGDIYNSVTGEFTLTAGRYNVALNIAWNTTVNGDAWVQVVSGTVLPAAAVCGNAIDGERVVSCSGGLVVPSGTAKIRARVGKIDSGTQKMSSYAYASPAPDAGVTTMAVYSEGTA